MNHAIGMYYVDYLTVPYSVHVTASEVSRQITYALLELDNDLLNGSKPNVCVAARIPYSIKTPKMREESHCRYNSESCIPPNSCPARTTF